MTAYQTLEERFARINALEGAEAVLHWDSAVIMPEGGASRRASQLEALASEIHQMVTAPEMEDLIGQARIDEASLTQWQKANLNEIERRWLHASAVDNQLVSAFSQAVSECELTWRSARHENNFKAIAPLLEKVLGHVREIAACKAERLNCSPYEALLDSYDPGQSCETIDKVFGELSDFLPSFLPEVIEHQQSRNLIPLEGPFSTAKQKELGLHGMQLLGFDFQKGRLDVSHHPFCGGVPGDVRITTRYNDKEFLSSLMGVMHETGHALYENNLPENWYHQPVGQARGMSMHESQSLFIEMQLCCSKEWVQYLQPTICKVFGGSGDAWSADNLYHHITKVERSFIRVDADEVTYPLHVMLRYRLEKALIAGDLQVADLPSAWRAGMKEFLGVEPDSDTNGCMQDIHWYGGDFGYFPTYTLGAMIAAQIFASIEKEHPDIRSRITKGDVAPLLNWTKDNIHQKASLLSTNGLLTEATGEALTATHYINHLKARYKEG